jgi:S1-C subfamily serine protease
MLTVHRLRLTAALAGSLTAVLAAGCTSGSTGGAAATAAPTSAPALQNDYARTVDAVLPSVVSITAGASLGSGVVYDSKGDILTNAHVVGTEQKFAVTLATDPAVLDATLIGSFPVGDLAVIRLTVPPPNLKPALFAKTPAPGIGTIVLAMGNPLGLASSVTDGIISALGRTVVEPPSGQAPQGLRIPDMVQTSAAINPGNSGGALVSLANQVVGINTLVAVDPGTGGAPANGIGFAIPAARAVQIADQLINNGQVVNSGLASLGVTTRSVVTTAGDPAGAGVVAAAGGGPADKAGVRTGDVITRLAGQSVGSSESLSAVLTGLKPGQQVGIGFQRDGQSLTATVTLGTL